MHWGEKKRKKVLAQEYIRPGCTERDRHKRSDKRIRQHHLVLTNLIAQEPILNDTTKIVIVGGIFNVTGKPVPLFNGLERKGRLGENRFPLWDLAVPTRCRS